ncbi:MAG: N-acetylmannosamine-6-phosphate 2-epimerase [Slackia sp.]
MIEQLRGKLIVSCQAYMGEPMRHPETMAQIACAAELGGAAAIRCQGLSDIAAIKGRVEIPVIGLWKEGHEGVYITPSVRHARAFIAAGSDLVAIDASGRLLPDGSTFEDTVEAVRAETLVMADCACMDDVRRALAAGVDIVSTTMAGYAPGREKRMVGLDFVREAVAVAGDTPVFCEGRVHTLGLARGRSMPAHSPWSWEPPSHIPRASRAGSATLCRRSNEGYRAFVL